MKCKGKNETISISPFLGYLKDYMAVQKYIAKTEGTEQKFKERWEKVERRLRRYQNEG